MERINLALSSNGATASMEKENEINKPENAIDGSYATGNGKNAWSGNSTKFLIKLPKKSKIDEIKVFSTNNWGYSISYFDLYYTANPNLDVNSDLSDFTFYGRVGGSFADRLGSVQITPINARQVLLYTPQQPKVAYAEIELWGVYLDGLLILKDNKYYSVHESQYNTSSQMFEEVVDITNSDVFFNIEDLFTEITIGDETFKPIDKFDKFQIVSKNSFELEVSALKFTQEMIATLEPLNMKKYATIHKITPNYDISGNGSIKIAFSFDDGITWKTWDATNNWTDLSNVEVPLKLYENFTDADKTAWSNAQTEINTNGIDIQNLSNVIFPSDVKKMCFAIVFNRPTYADTATLTSFDILFDGLKTFIGLDRDKCAVKFTGDTITVTPTSNADQLLITMITGTN